MLSVYRRREGVLSHRSNMDIWGSAACVRRMYRAAFVDSGGRLSFQEGNRSNKQMDTNVLNWTSRQARSRLTNY